MLKSRQEIEKMAVPSRLVARALEALRERVRPGVSTSDLDRFAEAFLQRAGARPAFKGYHGYPNSLCTSVNDQVVHCLPSEHPLEEGDIVGMDLGAFVDGYYGDAAITVPVGEVDEGARRLLQVTEEALCRGIEAVRVGNRVSDISHAIQSHAESQGFSVVTDFVGHGIGRQLHEDPQIPNFGLPGRGPRLKEGMVLAIEPMVNAGESAVSVKDTRWTVVTSDGSLSAHFEHTVAVTADGPNILTRF